MLFTLKVLDSFSTVMPPKSAVGGLVETQPLNGWCSESKRRARQSGKFTFTRSDRFRRVLTVSFSFLFVLFVGFQTLALIAFGPLVDSNILRAPA